MFRDRFRSIDRIAGIGSPLLVIAGTADTVVPVSQSQQLFQAHEPKRPLIRGAATTTRRAVRGLWRIRTFPHNARTRA
jgi:fermentation-respiration switch protein FrsA (DUF1100 family)